MFSAKIKKELEKSSNNNTELQLRRQSTHTNCTNDQSTLRKLSKHINQPRNTMKLVEFYNFFSLLDFLECDAAKQARWRFQ